MPSPNEITVSQLSRRIGLPDTPALVDVRIDEDVEADPRMIPGARRHDYRSVSEWSARYIGRQVVVICHRGKKLSHGVAAHLRADGIAAESLGGGMVGWREAAQPTIVTARLPPRDVHGHTVWVTRERPKIDRIACPWLIRRFIDPGARFLFVKASEVLDVADRLAAVPFDVDGVFWSHRGEICTFDTMLTEFGLDLPPLRQLARIIRGADTARLDLAPECAGLLAASLGYSRMFKDDLVQLDAAMSLYDALYRWCRDASDETHNWPGPAVMSQNG